MRELPASQAFAAAAKDAIHSAKVDPALIDQTVIGNVNYVSKVLCNLLFFNLQRIRSVRWGWEAVAESLDGPGLEFNKHSLV